MEIFFFFKASEHMKHIFYRLKEYDMLIVLPDLGIPLHFQSNDFGISLLNKKFFKRHLLDIFSLRKESRVRYLKKFCCNFCIVFFNISNEVCTRLILKFTFWLELTIFYTSWVTVCQTTVSFF